MKRVNARGAIISLWTGFVLGISRLVAEYAHKQGLLNVEEGSMMGVLLKINFLHYALYLFLICSAILIGASYLTPAQSPEQLKSVTYSRVVGKNTKIVGLDLWLTILLIACVFALWWLFSPLGIA